MIAMLPAVPPPARLRCFLVEDSPIILRSLIEALEQMAPITVVGHADEAEGALQWLEQHPGACDLVILDVYLRKGSGVQVLSALKQRHFAQRRIMLTNYATVDIRRRCLSLGADRVFDKSSELEELFAYCTERAEGVRS